MTRPLSEAKIAAIHSAAANENNPDRIAADLHLTPETVQQVLNGGVVGGNMLSLIIGQTTMQEFAEKAGFNLRWLNNIAQYHTPRFVYDKLLPYLKETYPGKETQIADFRAKYDAGIAAVAPNRHAPQKISAPARARTGSELKDCRLDCGVDFEAAKKLLQRSFRGQMVARNLERIEAGDEKLSVSIYRDAITELSTVYGNADCTKAGRHTIKLENLRDELKI